MNVTEPKLLRIADVMARVQLSKGSIAKLEKAGKFPKRIKLGGCARWKTSDIDEWLKSL